MTWTPGEKWGWQGYRKGEESLNELNYIKMGTQVESREGTEPETCIPVIPREPQPRPVKFYWASVLQFANWDMFSPRHPGANLKTASK